MARQKGMLNLSGNLEPLAGAPLDSRSITPTVADLYIASNWPYKYIGMKTTVTATGDTYRLVNLDVTQESSWVLDGGSGGQTIQVESMPLATESDLGKVLQYVGTTNLNYTNGYFYKCVYKNSSYLWEQHNVQPDAEGHTIQEDGTDMTSRAALNFVGMDVSDNSEDDSTDVEEHRLTSAEISEIMGGIPNPQPRYPVIFDERGTEYKVGWYILANGTKKPVYEKCFYNITLNPIQSGQTASITPIMDATNIKLLSSDSYCYTDNGSSGEYAKMLYASMDYSLCIKLRLEREHNKIEIVHKGQQFDSYKVNATIRYTKTTDTPV